MARVVIGVAAGAQFLWAAARLRQHELWQLRNDTPDPDWRMLRQDAASIERLLTHRHAPTVIEGGAVVFLTWGLTGLR